MPISAPPSGDPHDGDHNLDSTAYLFFLARQGDRQARDSLCARYSQILNRWAHGRLPLWARELADTEDLVQSILLHALDKMEGFDPRWEGAFLAYLRTGVRNKILDHIRRHKRRPEAVPLPEDLPDPGISPSDELAELERLEGYEAALDQLPDKDQQAVFLKVELGWPYQQIADALGFPSANAARMRVARAVLDIARRMK